MSALISHNCTFLLPLEQNVHQRLTANINQLLLPPDVEEELVERVTRFCVSKQRNHMSYRSRTYSLRLSCNITKQHYVEIAPLVFLSAAPLS